jgi:hypothetical protein
MAVNAVAADIEYWARTVSVDGRIGLNDLARVLDVIRQASSPQGPDVGARTIDLGDIRNVRGLANTGGRG